ncbi:apical sushi protein [Plasmodium malariae]|uniref:Apical sushi protein n=1 Tax=Plasmodium malariae TaxID=5858 RepID=A0A1D3JID9_PLAMA|nr:apical sushi protein [Plasmodium malariae]SBT86208.1 apical sushi protein [Plasmodium malariae]
MKIVCSTIIYLLSYKTIIKAKNAKYSSNFLNEFNKLDILWGGTNFEPLDLRKINVSSFFFKLHYIPSGFVFGECPQDVDAVCLFLQYSFIQDNKRKEVKMESKSKDEKNKINENKTASENADIDSQTTAQEILKRGVNFYINGGTSEYDYNNDEEFFKVFHHNNHKKKIEIYSPCFNLDENTCSNNKDCFYDHIYRACFQNCKALDENECSKYNECKATNKGCENEGYLSLEIFGSNLGSGVRACELFESEGSCYLMEELYKKFEDENKTNFNCVWLSHTHEFRKHKERDESKKELGKHGNHEKYEEKNENKHKIDDDIINIKRTNHINNSSGPINYHVLSAKESKEIGRNEKPISLVQLKVNEKANKDAKKKSNKKGGANEEQEDEEDEKDDEEDLQLNDENEDEEQQEEVEVDEEEEEGENSDNELEKKGAKKKGEKEKSDQTSANSEGEKRNVSNENNGNAPTSIGNNEGGNNERSNGKSGDTDDSVNENMSKEDELQKVPKNSTNDKTELVTESIINENDASDKSNKENFITDINQMGEKKNINEYTNFKENNEHSQNEKEIIIHEHHYDDNKGGYDEYVRVESHICANLNEKPNPSVLLEGALMAEKEAELRILKKKYNITDNDICVKPSNEPHIILNPDKKFYVIGEKIEFKCPDGYKIIGTTNVGVCTGRNKIVPNISCESLKDFNETEKQNIQKLNSIIS